METRIVLPGDVETFDCQVPGCKDRFVNKDAYLRHVPKCVRMHRESILTLSEEHEYEIDADPFQRVWDPEALEWVQKRIRDSKQ